MVHNPKRLNGRSPLSITLLLIVTTVIDLVGGALPVAAGSTTDPTGAYCRFSNEAIAQKEALRQASLQGDAQAQADYQAILAQHAQWLEDCRSDTWPEEQAIWVRLYPCDALPGVMDALMDDLVNKGYNRVYVETFFNGQILLPEAENDTPWPSVIRTPGYENTDLLAIAIDKAHERGLTAYSWMFTMNFGYTYSQRSDRQSAMAVNGYGQTSITYGGTAGLSSTSEEAFIDPYSNLAKQDYYNMVQAVMERNPDGMLFDYIRYPRGSGGASVASRVQDLWIYGSAARQALYNRAQNERGRYLIQRYLDQGYISARDIDSAKSLYSQETEPLWQGRTPFHSINADSDDLQPYLQDELWYLVVAHAAQGVLDFLSTAAVTPTQAGIPVGTVFFPEANESVGEGFDSRLQPWDQFPSQYERHPMSYGVCGNTSCIVSQVQTVISQTPAGTEVKPVLAGMWGQATDSRPSLEQQMQAIHQAAPAIRSISHFAYSWQEPQFDNDRKFCELP
jgi:hypothetical protein